MTTRPEAISVADVTDDDARPVTYWLAADGQSSLDMTGATAAEAKAELLAQCGTDGDRAGILAGSLQLAGDETAKAALRGGGE